MECDVYFSHSIQSTNVLCIRHLIAATNQNKVDYYMDINIPTALCNAHYKNKEDNMNIIQNGTSDTRGQKSQANESAGSVDIRWGWMNHAR